MNKILMCTPTHFQVSYEINPWMISNIGQVDNKKANDQWNTLFNELAKHSIIYLIDTIEDCPDLVFTANGGFISNNTAILSKFSTIERRNEEPIFGSWFASKGYDVYKPSYNYEGEGDHLIDNNNRHWLGSGFRTDTRVAAELEDILNTDINVLELTDPRWYHLDTCFCPLPDGEILWYPDAFSKSSRDLIYSSFQKSIEVSEKDALLFACNCVVLGNHLFLPKGSDVWKQLESIGYTIHEFELGEFIKSGGAAKCLVLHVSV